MTFSSLHFMICSFKIFHPSQVPNHFGTRFSTRTSSKSCGWSHGWWYPSGLNCWWCGVFTWFVEDMGGYGDVRIGPPGVCRYLVGKGAESRSRSGSVAMVWIHSRFCDSSAPWTKWEQTQCQPPVSSTPLLESNSWCIFLRGWLTILTHACVILHEVRRQFMYRWCKSNCVR